MSEFGADAAPRFPLGKTLITYGAKEVLSSDDVAAALARHVVGDWGDLCVADKARNDRALVDEERLLSVYYSKGGVRFYVITEWDRSVTTILLPSEN